MSHHNSTEIVQDPSVCRLIDLKLSLYKYWESPHPTLMIDGRDTITVSIINFMRLSGLIWFIGNSFKRKSVPFAILGFDFVLRLPAWTRDPCFRNLVATNELPRQRMKFECMSTRVVQLSKERFEAVTKSPSELNN